LASKLPLGKLFNYDDTAYGAKCNEVNKFPTLTTSLQNISHAIKIEIAKLRLALQLTLKRQTDIRKALVNGNIMGSNERSVTIV